MHTGGGYGVLDAGHVSCLQQADCSCDSLQLTVQASLFRYGRYGSVRIPVERTDPFRTRVRADRTKMKCHLLSLFAFLLSAYCTPIRSETTSAVACQLKISSAIKASAHNQIIELLDIADMFQAGIIIQGYENVTVRNVRIKHSPLSAGLVFSNAHGLTLQNITVTLQQSPPTGCLPDSGDHNYTAMHDWSLVHD